MGAPGDDSFQGAAYIFGAIPSAVKQGVISNLQALLPTGNVSTDALLKVAISMLSKSVNPSSYLDALHLKGTTGILVFTFEQTAVRQLMVIRNPPAAIAPALNNLAQADQVFAQTAIADAIARGGKPAKIAKAQGQLAQAHAAAGTGNVFRAIGFFRSAWQTAMGA
ncbi:MAG: hypothetical protein HY713_12050 [candidate division NC10 bacterium]|nr:hypothetical protein [candidate division NC10 bacterium]